MIYHKIAVVCKKQSIIDRFMARFCTMLHAGPNTMYDPTKNKNQIKESRNS